MRPVARRVALLVLAIVVATLHPVPYTVDAAAQGADGPTSPSPNRIVRQAYDLLIDELVIPAEPARLVKAGWDAAKAALRAKGVESLPEGDPELTNDRTADWRALMARYPELVKAAGDKLEQIWLDRAIVDGMARSIDEGHTYYLTPDQYQRQVALSRNNDRLIGIGITLGEDLVIVNVIEGGPADKGGLKPGDKIIAVDGVSTEGMSIEQVGPRIRGAAGTTVELTVKRPDVDEPVTLTFVRTEIRLDWIQSRIVAGNVGYLQIRHFPLPDSMPSFRRAIQQFIEADVSGLVIDVRDNPGGVIVTGIEVISTFVKNGPIFQQTDRQGGQRTVTAFGDYWDREIPISVLVNGNSASMAEITASALKENGVADIVGTKSAGVVSATIYHPLYDGSGLAVTTQLIKSGQGKPLDRIGVEPDRIVEQDLGALRLGKDVQLDAALGHVRERVAARSARLPIHWLRIPGAASNLASLPMAA